MYLNTTAKFFTHSAGDGNFIILLFVRDIPGWGLNLNNTLLRQETRKALATSEVFRALEEPRRAGTFDECIKVHSSGLDFQPAQYINPSFTA